MKRIIYRVSTAALGRGIEYNMQFHGRCAVLEDSMHLVDNKQIRPVCSDQMVVQVQRIQERCTLSLRLEMVAKSPCVSWSFRLKRNIAQPVHEILP